MCQPGLVLGPGRTAYTNLCVHTSNAAVAAFLSQRPGFLAAPQSRPLNCCTAFCSHFLPGPLAACGLLVALPVPVALELLVLLLLPPLLLPQSLQAVAMLMVPAHTPLTPLLLVLLLLAALLLLLPLLQMVVLSLALTSAPSTPPLLLLLLLAVLLLLPPLLQVVVLPLASFGAPASPPTLPLLLLRDTAQLAALAASSRSLLSLSSSRCVELSTCSSNGQGKAGDGAASKYCVCWHDCHSRCDRPLQPPPRP